MWICLSSYHSSTPLPGPIILLKQQSARPPTTHGRPGSRTTFLLGCVSSKICLCVYVFLCDSYAPTPGWTHHYSAETAIRRSTVHTLKAMLLNHIFARLCFLVDLFVCLCVLVFLYAPTPAWLDPPSFCRSSNQQDHGPLTPSTSVSSRTLPLFFYL